MLVEFDEITYRFEETRPAAKITQCSPSTTGIFRLGVVTSGTITCAAIGERDVHSTLTIDMQVVEIKQVPIRAPDVTAIATVETNATNLHRIV